MKKKLFTLIFLISLSVQAQSLLINLKNLKQSLRILKQQLETLEPTVYQLDPNVIIGYILDELSDESKKVFLKIFDPAINPTKREKLIKKLSELEQTFALYIIEKFSKENYNLLLEILKTKVGGPSAKPSLTIEKPKQFIIDQEIVKEAGKRLRHVTEEERRIDLEEKKRVRETMKTFRDRLLDEIKAGKELRPVVQVRGKELPQISEEEELTSDKVISYILKNASKPTKQAFKLFFNPKIDNDAKESIIGSLEVPDLTKLIYITENFSDEDREILNELLTADEKNEIEVIPQVEELPTYEPAPAPPPLMQFVPTEEQIKEGRKFYRELDDEQKKMVEDRFEQFQKELTQKTREREKRLERGGKIETEIKEKEEELANILAKAMQARRAEFLGEETEEYEPQEYQYTQEEKEETKPAVNIAQVLFNRITEKFGEREEETSEEEWTDEGEE